MHAHINGIKIPQLCKRGLRLYFKLHISITLFVFAQLMLVQDLPLIHLLRKVPKMALILSAFTPNYSVKYLRLRSTASRGEETNWGLFLGGFLRLKDLLVVDPFSLQP